MSAVENFTEPGGHLFERADHHGLSRTGRNAGGLFAFGKALGAEIALEHDAAARKLGRNVEIEAHAGLALRDVPRTHVPAFCTAEADVRVDGDGAFLRLVDGAERTELAAWCVEAVHAAARQMNVAAVDAERLDVEEVVGRETDLAFAGFVDDADRITFNGNGDVEAVRRVDGKGADGPAAFGDFGKERFKRLNDGQSARVAHDGRFVEAELLGFEKLERSAGDGEEAVAFRARALSGAPAKLGLGLLQGVHRDEGRTKLCVRRFGGHRRIRTMIVVFGPEIALHEEAGTDRFGTVAAAFRPEFVT